MTFDLKSIKDCCVYLWGWGPCPPRRKARSSARSLAVWCQNCTHHPSECPEEDAGRIWAAQEPSRASLKNKAQSETTVAHVFMNEEIQRCGPYKLWTRLTCIESVRVIVFAGRAEAGQAIIRDFQNKSTVHHAIRWLQISMAADVAVVEIIHSLVERSVKSSIKGCSPPLFSPLYCKSYMKTQIQTYGNNMLWQVDVCCSFWNDALFQGRHSHWGNFCEITVNSFGRRRGGAASTLVQYFVEMVSQTSLKAAASPLHCTTLLSAWSNLAAALPHTWSSIQSSQQGVSLLGRIENNLLKNGRD